MPGFGRGARRGPRQTGYRRAQSDACSAGRGRHRRARRVGTGDQDADDDGETFELLAEAGIVPNELALRLRMAVGFRNIAIHNYERIDWQIVHRLCQRGLTDFEDFARIVADRSPL